VYERSKVRKFRRPLRRICRRRTATSATTRIIDDGTFHGAWHGQTTMITSFRNFPDGPASNDEHKSARALEANIVQPLSILQYLLIGTSEGPGGALGWVATRSTKAEIRGTRSLATSRSHLQKVNFSYCITRRLIASQSLSLKLYGPKIKSPWPFAKFVVFPCLTNWKTSQCTIPSISDPDIRQDPRTVWCLGTVLYHSKLWLPSRASSRVAFLLFVTRCG
jgi:hypothetical protein